MGLLSLGFFIKIWVFATVRNTTAWKKGALLLEVLELSPNRGNIVFHTSVSLLCISNWSSSNLCSLPVWVAMKSKGAQALPFYHCLMLLAKDSILVLFVIDSLVFSCLLPHWHSHSVIWFKCWLHISLLGNQCLHDQRGNYKSQLSPWTLKFGSWSWISSQTSVLIGRRFPVFLMSRSISVGLHWAGRSWVLQPIVQSESF
jgi:hypothetical protein